MPLFESSGHLNEGSLGLYALGDLPQIRRRRADEHLSRCPVCRGHLRAFVELAVLLKAAAQRSAVKMPVLRTATRSASGGAAA
jgi:anti-sigma factor RsiW